VLYASHSIRVRQTHSEHDFGYFGITGYCTLGQL